MGMCRGNDKGHLIIDFDIKFPTSLNENQIKQISNALS